MNTGSLARFGRHGGLGFGRRFLLPISEMAFLSSVTIHEHSTNDMLHKCYTAPRPSLRYAISSNCFRWLRHDLQVVQQQPQQELLAQPPRLPCPA